MTTSAVEMIFIDNILLYNQPGIKICSSDTYFLSWPHPSSYLAEFLPEAIKKGGEVKPNKNLEHPKHTNTKISRFFSGGVTL
jgi:hypothetical protein